MSALKVSFNHKVIREFGPEDRRYWLWANECEGLGLLVLPSGVMTFYVVQKVGGKTEKVRIGRYPRVPPEAAIRRAKAITGRFALGENPAQEAREEKAAAAAAVSVERAWKGWLAARKRGADARRLRAIPFDEGRWSKHLKPYFGSVPVDSISRRDVISWHETITSEAGPVAANRAAALLRAILQHHIDRLDAPSVNPAARLGKVLNREQPRKRVLSPAELRRWWKAVLTLPSEDAAELLAVAQLTLARKRTLLHAAWEHIDLTRGLWSIPGEQLKSGEPWTVPLSAAARGALRARWQRRGSPTQGRVWPARLDAETGTPGADQLVRLSWAWVLKEAGIDDYHLHDLRSTGATVALDAGVDPSVGRYLLQHRDPAVTGRYRLVRIQTAMAGAEAMGRALLHFAGLVPEDFNQGVPEVGVMRDEAEVSSILPFVAGP